MLSTAALKLLKMLKPFPVPRAVDAAADCIFFTEHLKNAMLFLAVHDQPSTLLPVIVMAYLLS